MPPVEVLRALVAREDPEADDGAGCQVVERGAHQVAGHTTAPGARVQIDGVDLEVTGLGVLVAARTDAREPDDPRTVLGDEQVALSRQGRGPVPCPVGDFERSQVGVGQDL